MKLRHFLQLSDCSSDELKKIIAQAISVKINGQASKPADNKTLAMIFEKSSTRTRVSFEAGFANLGGKALFLDTNSLQLGRGEPIADTARVISSMVDMVMMRTFGHQRIVDFASHSTAPVINGLTDSYHPCQILADLMTYTELRGEIADTRVAFVGDCNNNVCASYIEAASIFDFQLVLACPEQYQPNTDDTIEIFRNPEDAIKDADLVVTDVWVSMGNETERSHRLTVLADYQINSALLDVGNNPLFLHCLPAHRGEEVDEQVLDDRRSGVWQASENRLHVQKSLMEFLLYVNQI